MLILVILLFVEFAHVSCDQLMLVQLKGLDQARKLGLSLKRRYADTGFVDARYIPSEVSFRSSASERCLMTASAVASAMFNQTESGQPTFVPIFTVPKDKDFVCVPRVQCPPVMREMMKLLGLSGPLWKMVRILLRMGHEGKMGVRDDMLSELFKQESERLNYTYN
ncbi:hypothetical protein ANCDUO_25341, partial [Ancylostoma duodenale]